MAMLVQPRFKPQPPPEQIQTLREPPPTATPAMGASPRDVEIRKLMARDLAKSAGDSSPVQHWLQGVNRVADGALGAFQDYTARQEEKKGREGANAALQQFLTDDKTGDPSTRVSRALMLAQNPWLDEGAQKVIGAISAQAMESPADKRLRDLQLAKLEGEVGQIGKAKPTEMQSNYEYARQNGFAGTFDDFMAANKGGVNIDMGGGTNKQVFEAMNESATSARAAMTGLNSLREAKGAMEAGGIFGAGADYRLGFAKLGSLLGIGDESTITNTETFRSAIAPQIAAMMKATVGSTQISNADREFAEKAAGGAITLEPKTITRLLDIMQRAGEVAIQTHVEKLNKVYPQGQKFDRERALFDIQMPQAAAPPPPPPGAGPPAPAQFTPTDGAPAAPAPQKRTPSPASIENLKKDPSTAAQFDEYFGPGASQAILSGGAGGPEMAAPPGPAMAPAAAAPAPQPAGWPWGGTSSNPALGDLRQQQEEMTRRHKRMLTRGP